MRERDSAIRETLEWIGESGLRRADWRGAGAPSYWLPQDLRKPPSLMCKIEVTNILMKNELVPDGEQPMGVRNYNMNPQKDIIYSTI